MERKTKRLVVLLLAVLFLSCALWADISPITSVGFSATGGFFSVDNISMLDASVGIKAAIGADLTDSFGLFAIGGLDFYLPLKNFNRFLALNGLVEGFMGIGAIYRWGSWSLSGDMALGIGKIGDDYFSSLIISTTPKFVFLELNDEPLGYSIGIPISAQFRKDLVSFNIGVVVSMEVGRNLR